MYCSWGEYIEIRLEQCYHHYLMNIGIKDTRRKVLPHLFNHTCYETSMLPLGVGYGGDVLPWNKTNIYSYCLFCVVPWHHDVYFQLCTKWPYKQTNIKCLIYLMIQANQEATLNFKQGNYNLTIWLHPNQIVSHLTTTGHERGRNKFGQKSNWSWWPLLFIPGQ